jgi:hypothetical protein
MGLHDQGHAKPRDIQEATGNQTPERAHGSDARPDESDVWVKAVDFAGLRATWAEGVYSAGVSPYSACAHALSSADRAAREAFGLGSSVLRHGPSPGETLAVSPVM